MIEAVAVFVFSVSVAFILYILVGYPLMLDLLARRRANPVQKRPIEPTVSVILPVYNGERWLAAKIESLRALDYPKHLIDILVVSDGSQDRTAEIARSLEGVRLLEIPHGGKARAINAALEAVSGEVLLFTDVRQQLEPGCLRPLLANLGDPRVGAATAELRLLPSTRAEEADAGAYLRFEHWIRDRLSKIDSLLGVAGALYVIRRELARPLPPDTLLDDVCMVLPPFFAGYRVVMEPAAVAFDEPVPLKGEFRRKVRTIAGLYQTLRAYPALLGSANRMRLHFISHKLGRVWLPFFLAPAALSSFWLPAPWSRFALTGQAAFLLLAGIDLLIPQWFPLKRLTSAARTFLVMMAAAVGGLSVFFVSPLVLWKSSGEKSTVKAG
ncbi:MAG: glycosyltransferase family 2 protein [Acidobacteria bacterium]|nr:glycosyltransferase family 2 protein [Acidobacteriota bacterium]